MILSREKRYLSAAFLFFVVRKQYRPMCPMCFKRATPFVLTKSTRTFRHLDTEVGTLSDDVESGANSGGPDEDYTYSQKNLTVGRDKLTVLGRTYDIVEIDTLSFKDHDVFSVKFPSKGNYGSNYLNAKSLDSVNFSLSMPVTRERRYDDKLGYSDRISGYPARSPSQ